MHIPRSCDWHTYTLILMLTSGAALLLLSCSLSSFEVFNSHRRAPNNFRGNDDSPRNYPRAIEERGGEIIVLSHDGIKEEVERSLWIASSTFLSSSRNRRFSQVSKSSLLLFPKYGWRGKFIAPINFEFNLHRGGCGKLSGIGLCVSWR